MEPGPISDMDDPDVITVACLLWGDWCHPHGEGYVRKLRDRMRRHLTVPHRFVCLSDRDIDGVETIRFEPRFTWNLNKFHLYRPDIGLQGRVLAIDLDVVPIGPMDDFALYGGEFAVCESFGDKGQCGGSILSFEGGTMGWLYEKIAANPKFWAEATGGSERMFLRHALKRPDFWQDLNPGKVASWKRHCTGGIPDGTCALVFHGEPRPHEVGF